MLLQLQEDVLTLRPNPPCRQNGALATAFSQSEGFGRDGDPNSSHVRWYLKSFRYGVHFRQSARSRANTQQLSNLEALSNELLHLVFDSFKTSVKDFVAPGPCSAPLWDVFVRKMDTGSLKCSAPWAGEKIAFVSSWISDHGPSFADGGVPKECIDSRICINSPSPLLKNTEFPGLFTSRKQRVGSLSEFTFLQNHTTTDLLP